MGIQQVHFGQLINTCDINSFIPLQNNEEGLSFTSKDNFWHHGQMSSLFLDVIADRAKERELRSHLKRFAYSLCYDRDNAEDLVQQTYEKAFKNHKSFTGSNLKSWMFTICKNSFIDEYKKGTKWEEFSDRDFDGTKDKRLGTRVKIVQSIGNRDDIPPIPVEGEQFKEIEEAEALEKIELCISQLTSQEQEIIQLRRSGLSVSEISENTGLSRENVSQISRRARIKLCESMGVDL